MEIENDRVWIRFGRDPINRTKEVKWEAWGMINFFRNWNIGFDIRIGRVAKNRRRVWTESIIP